MEDSSHHSDPSRTGSDLSDESFNLQGVSKQFGKKDKAVWALYDLNLCAEKNLITGLAGPDGAGKTTLMRLLVGILKPDKGKIRVLGMDIDEKPRLVQTKIGYMPQQFGLYEDLSVMENLTLFADLQGVAQTDRKAKFEELMQMTRLHQFHNRLAGRLSGGMKQKLGLACTLVRDPDLLILDEPTAGVDPISRKELWSIIKRLVDESGISVLLSTAYLDEVERCDQVAIIHEGRLLDAGTPENLSSPQSGKIFTVRVEKMKKRRLQDRLLSIPRIDDAVILGDSVRIITSDGRAPTADELGVSEKDTQITQSSPRFEDAYVCLLQKQDQPNGEKEQTQIVFSAEERSSSTPSDKAEKIIEVDHVKKKFGDFYAVKDVTFNVGQGEVFGLLGANGAGKTTTFRMLCGLLPVTEGALYVAGENLRVAAARARARIGYMSQKFSLYGQLTVMENLEFFSSAYSLKGKQKNERIQWALEQFNLHSFAGAAGNDLPLGFKQRLALACALMHEPEILFLDEPTSGVDPMARREFWIQINRLAENGVTVMVTTHFMEEAEYCDRLALMMAGKIFALGSPAEVKNTARQKSGDPIHTMEDAFITLMQEN